MEPHNKSKNIGITIGVIVVLAIIAAVVFANKQSDMATTPAPVETTDTTSTPTDSTMPQTTPVADTKSGSVYKDGTYTATGSYISPGGPDHVGVTLTLKDDIITNITVTPEPGDNTSKKYQGYFVSGYKPLVIGKDIATVNLSKVSGSSLTSKGFNDALAQIEVQAKA
jgi:uncharacterized protein with FMN-binding domain